MWLRNADWSILYWMQENLRCDWLDGFMSVFTLLGEFGIVWIVWAAVLLCRRKQRKGGALVLFGLLLSLLFCNILLKNLVARPRPCMLDTTVRLVIATPKEWSFPSGHAASSAVSATVLTLHDRRQGVPAIVLCVLLCFSRMYLFVHFPTDILGGLLLGTLLGFAAYCLGGRVYNASETKIRNRRKS